MNHDPVKDHAERKRVHALIERCAKEQTEREGEQMKEIKTCPFCGSKAEVYEECEMIKIRCSSYMCQASIMNWHDEVEDAIEAWNERASDDEH